VEKLKRLRITLSAIEQIENLFFGILRGRDGSLSRPFLVAVASEKTAY